MMWTEGRIKSFIISVLRTGARRWPPRYEALADACVGQKINIKSGRLAKHYICNECKEEFTSKDVEIDHIQPAVSIQEGFIDWNEFIKRLYCEKENLQCLCKDCHLKKTLKERQIARMHKMSKTKDT